MLDNEKGVGATDEEALELYKTMMLCTTPFQASLATELQLTTLVSIMDLIMFEAQRQGRLSFYMVLASLCSGNMQDTYRI